MYQESVINVHRPKTSSKNTTATKSEFTITSKSILNQHHTQNKIHKSLPKDEKEASKHGNDAQGQKEGKR